MKTAWTEAETQIIKAMFKTEPASEICKAIPGRTWLSIHAKAQRLGLHRDKGEREDALELAEQIRLKLNIKYPSRAERGLW